MVGGNIENSDEIKILIDPNDKNSLIGFQIHMENDDKQVAEAIAELKARRLSNFLTIKSNMLVEYGKPSISAVEDNTVTIFNTLPTTSISVSAGYDLNLNDQTMRSTIDCDSQINQHLYYYHNGLKAFKERDFPIAIKEFFIIIENQNLSDIRKYRALRNAVSHEVLDEKNTISELNNLGIAIKKGDYLNTNDREIEAILEHEATNLMRITKQFVETELKV
ncbi:MAG: hypothetical protein ACREBI_07725 [Nitrosotalea sp.]